MSKEAYYFSHDSNARHDPKILALRSELGIRGYGIYWVVIEMLREQDEFKLPKKQYIWNAIAMQVQCKDFAKDDAKHFVEFCINECDLLVEDDDFFWSESLLKRMDKKNELSEKRRKAANARWEKSNDTNDIDNSGDANAMQTDANAMQTDARKGNKRKGNVKEKESKTIYAEYVTMTESEFNKLVEKHGQANVKKMIEVLDNYKGANNKKYASDYRAILNWVVERVIQPKKEERFNLDD